MRMWMIEPKYMCNKHILGCHGELHKFKKSFEKGISIEGRIKPIVQIEPKRMQERHDELAAEMTRRGMNHNSPYEQPDLSKYPDDQLNVKVDEEYNIKDLSDRCDECHKRLKYYWRTLY